MAALNRVTQGLLVSMFSSGLMAAEVPERKDEESEALPVLGTVISTGARGANRTVQSSPTPIDVLSADSLGQANQTNVLQALNTLLPSFNVPSLPTYGINSVVKAGQLRGLNSSHVLVLVNGKRRHATARLGAGNFAASAPVDLSLIPSGSIERIEVLRDGASALYGSDAIAGVINIITKNDDHGGSLSVRNGQYFEGDGNVREYIGNAGFKLGENGGHLHLSAQWDDQESAYRDSPVPDNIQFYFPRNAAGQQISPTGNSSTGPTLPAGATPDPREAGVDRDDIVFGASGGVPETRLGALTVDFGLPINDALEFYGFASYADRTGRSAQHYRFPSRDQVIREIWPDGFTPYSGVKEKDYSVQLGFKGDDFAGWDWDLSSVYGRDLMDTYVYDSNSPSYGLASKKNFFLGDYEYSAWTNNFDLRRELVGGLLGIPSDVSLGAEYRHETYRRGAGEVQSWAHGGQPILSGPNAGRPISISDAGSQADTGVRPEDTASDSRDSYAVYAGLSIYPTDPWVVDLAARFETYDDFGSITTGRVSSRYDFTPRFGIRGTVSTGFQAPALAAQSYRSTGVTVNSTNHILAANSAEARALGAQSLEPEESVSFSIGAVLRPLDNLSVAVDAYQIDVDNRISQLTTFSESTHPGAGALVRAASPLFGPNDGIAYLINAGNTRTRGVDLTLENSHDLGRFGRLSLTAAANWNKTELKEIADTPGVLSALNIPLYSAASQANLLYLAPRFKAVLGGHWSLDKWSAGVTATRYGEIQRTTNVSQNGVSTPTVFSVGDLWLVDLAIGYQFTEQLGLQLNANNLFDKKPKKLVDGSTSLWPFQSYSYVMNGPVNAAGGLYSATLTYNW